jgi:hypothetical protein
MIIKLMVEMDGYEEEQQVEVDCGNHRDDFEIDAIMFEGVDIQHKIPDILTNWIYTECLAVANAERAANREYWAESRAGR